MGKGGTEGIDKAGSMAKEKGHARERGRKNEKGAAKKEDNRISQRGREEAIELGTSSK